MSTEWLVTNLLAAWLLPPLDFILLIAIGLAIALKKRRVGLALSAGALAVLSAISTGVVSNFLISTVEAGIYPITLEQARDSRAGAIVILGAGHRVSPEYGGETVSDRALVRMRYGARIARATQIPILVTGGKPIGGIASEADLMAFAFEQDFGITVRWREGNSINTIENSQFSARMLNKVGVTRVILVTDAWHMARSAGRFRAAGLEVVPAPTGFLAHVGHTPVDFLPSAEGLRQSTRAIREWVGIFVSRARRV